MGCVQLGIASISSSPSTPCGAGYSATLRLLSFSFSFSFAILGFGFGLVTLGFLTAVREAGDGVDVDVDAAVPRRFCCDCGVVFGDGDGVA